MNEKIEETLKRLAAAMQPGEMGNQINNQLQPTASSDELAGDPNCPICGGLGYLRLDVPIGHPEFGRLQECTCRKERLSQQIRRRLFTLSNLDNLSHLTFENFQPRGRVGLGPWQADSLERAYNHARQFAQKLEGWLLLYGGYGCGKTHLAAAIANFAVTIGVPTLFITVPDLLDNLRQTFNDPDSTFGERFEEIRGSPLLVMDDFGTHNATLWAQEKLFQILNFRYINRLPLVVTTNLMMEQIEGRIRSRLEDPDLVTRVYILAPDYRNPTDDSGASRLSSLALHSDQTFSRFDDRRGEGLPEEDLRSLEKALKTATEYAKKPRGWLVFTGPYGCGKTHLAAAVANYRADLGQSTIFIGVPDLLDHLRATFNPSSPLSMDQVFEEIRAAPLLILDDLGAQSSTPWAKEKLFQLFDYRYNAKLPTIITTASYTEEIDPRLVSRMEDTRLCTICPITTPSYRGASPKKGMKPTGRSKSSG